MDCCGFSNSEEPLKRKIVIVGDGACGKTSLLSRFSRGKFPEVRNKSNNRTTVLFIYTIFIIGRLYSNHF
jgi:Rho family protein